jgi:peptidoglycan hydrolase-like protein with peptidoglycan-binding domain
MFRERTRCFRRLLVGLTAAALLLSLPATGLAAERENRSGQLASAGLLQRGTGYGTEAGSKAVRQLQLRLRRLGDRPGPIDGLYGPLTEAAVERFQRSHGLAIDGVVGPQTKGRILAQRAEQPSTRSHRPAQTGKPERKSPAQDQRAESAREQSPVRPSAGVGLGRPDPESSSGLPPLLVALGAGLVAASLLMSLRARRREAIEARLNLGLVFAALLAACVLGAAVGALFATQAAPDDSDPDRTTADSGALLASRTGPAVPTARTSPKTKPAGRAQASEPTGRSDPAGQSRAKRTRSSAATTSTARAQAQMSPAPSAPAPATSAAGPTTSDPGPATSDPGPATPSPAPARPAPEPPPAPAPAGVPSSPAPAVPVERSADGRSADAVTYTVRPGDALWPIARRQLAPDSSDHDVASKVEDLEALNFDERIGSGDPDVIVAGEELRLR